MSNLFRIVMKISLKNYLVCMLCLMITSVEAQWYQDEAAIMGTNIRVELWAENDAVGKIALASVMDEMRRINNLMSPYIEQSELSRLNREAKNRRSDNKQRVV